MTFARKLTTERLAAAILFIMLFAIAVRVPLDTDTWWHIRSGEQIVDTGRVPHTDPFSHTRLGQDWIDHSWGSQVALYAAYELFGGGTAPGDSGNIGLALFTATLATIGMALVYLMCEGNAYLRAFAVVLGASAAAVFWSPRPQMFSFALSALVLYLLMLYKRKHIDRLWFIPPIMALWSNLHGGFALGFIIMVGVLAGEVLGNLFNPDDERVIRWTRLRKPALVAVVSIPAIMLNPFGVTMLGYPLRTVRIGVLQDYIQEWASPNFHQLQMWPFALLLLDTLVALGLTARRADWTDLALTAGTAMLALMGGRNIALFAVAATPVLTRAVDAWLEDRGWQIVPARRVRGARLALNWILLAVIAAGALAKIAATLNTTTMRDAQKASLPVEAAAYLNETPPPGEMFNTYNWGGYLMFAAPDVPVYVDGRTDLYDDDFLRDYLKITYLRDDWLDKLQAQDIGFVVIEANSVLASGLRAYPDLWRERQFDDGRSSIFVRQES
ncbi:MAG TPA: hypothetical protein PKD09_00235 [Aggregatilinea sp.]|uniref:hypothetical protein n=1 Tax=Aggregatilinea sp. TaxID=2806333 RepID=UPI002BDEF547|nr:hypothetical protein [Aggregatilinea sp.]HML20042.1 hypothetical protein [Aggregatilinea sp.]